jgi:parallel beta-helix repeat protein
MYAYLKPKSNFMKNKHTQTMASLFISFFLSFCSIPLFSQVCITYADITTAIDGNGLQSFTMNGKRIINTDLNFKLGRCIDLRNCQNITITNCIFGPSADLAIYLYNCENVTITNCIFLDCSSGVTVNGGDNIKVNNNQFINMKGRPTSNGSFVQMYKIINGSGFEIMNNVGENITEFCDSEDLINIGNATFTSLSPLKIIGNQFRGYGTSESGSGINVGDDYDLSWPTTTNVIIKDNTLVNPGAVGIWSNGFNTLYENNKIFGELRANSNAGMIMTDNYNRGQCGNITFNRNQVYYWHGLNNGPVPWIYFQPTYFPTSPTCSNVTFGQGADANDFGAAIDATILPERLLCPFPVAYMKFDSNLNDYCGSALNATAYGSAGITCDTYRKAAVFYGGGSDAMTLPRSTLLKPSSQMISVSAWIKPDATSNIQGFIRSQDANGWDDGWRGVLDNSTAYFSLMTNNGRVSVSMWGIVANDWNHVAFTYDGKTMKGYLNGTLMMSSILAGYIYYNHTANLYLGWSEGTYNFSGKIAEVKISQGIVNDTEIAAEYNSLVDIFNGTVSTISIGGTYSANGQSKPLYTVNGVLADSYGTVTASAAGATSYQWQLLSGNPNYSYLYGQYAYISIPNSGSVNLRMTVTASCAATATRDFVLYANLYEPFKIKLIPGKNDIEIVKPTQETGGIYANSNKLIPGINLRPPMNKGSYTVQVVNTLGQVIKTGTFTDGFLTLNINNAIAGVYVVRVMNKFGVVYTEKVIKW